MNIVYLLESTDLCGGVKVVFNHAATLRERGHSAAVLSPDPYPSWFDKKVLFHRIDLKTFHNIPFFNDIDLIIATSPLHILSTYQHLHLDTTEYINQKCKYKLVHFVQGYELDYDESKPFTEMITQAYALNIPKITVSERLSQRLSVLYPDRNFMTCGQGLESDIFFSQDFSAQPAHIFDTTLCDAVFLIGPFDISIKRIADGLRAFKRASGKKRNLKLIRISAIDTRAIEEEVLDGKIDEYHLSLTPWEVGELFRRKMGILLSPSSSGEGFGLPALEAMACGIPTVLTDIPSYRAFSSPDDYASFVPVGNSEKMAEAIIEISENQLLRDRLIKRGIAVSKEYSYSQVAVNMERCLSDILNDLHAD